MFRRFLRGVLVAATAGIGASMLNPIAAYANVACGQTITTSLTLTHDLVCSGDGIIVGASNVTLNLGGHTITGPAPVPGSGREGVAVTFGHRSVTITNGTIEGFDLAVNMHGRASATVNALEIKGSFHGVNTQTDSSGSRISGNTFSNTTHNSIQLGGNAHSVEGNTIMNAASSAMLVSGSGNVVRGNRISDPAAVGVSVLAFPSNTGPFSDNQIRGNLITGAGRVFNSPGISVSNGSRTVVENNDVTGRRATPGIFINNSAGTVISSNSFVRNGSGVVVEGSNGTRIIGNRVMQNAFSGITVENTSTETLVSANFAYENGENGIQVLSPSSTVASNSAHFNGNWGIFAVAGVTDGGGNRASGNGQSAQCTPNIVCS